MEDREKSLQEVCHGAISVQPGPTQMNSQRRLRERSPYEAEDIDDAQRRARREQ
jgi:hypothetical protein